MAGLKRFVTSFRSFFGWFPKWALSLIFLPNCDISSINCSVLNVLVVGMKLKL